MFLSIHYVQTFLPVTVPYGECHVRALLAQSVYFIVFLRSTFHVRYISQEIWFVLPCSSSYLIAETFLQKL